MEHVTKGQYQKVKIIYSPGFWEFLKDEAYENFENYTLQNLFEMYMIQMKWCELPKDKEIPDYYFSVWYGE